MYPSCFGTFGLRESNDTDDYVINQSFCNFIQHPMNHKISQISQIYKSLTHK